MKRLILAVLTASVLGLHGEQRASAQVFGASPFQSQPFQFGTYSQPAVSPYYYPAVSPYLNILRGGIGGAGINYYNFTLPQFQTAGSLLQLQNQTNMLTQNQQMLLQGGMFGPGMYGQGMYGPGMYGPGMSGQGLYGQGLYGQGLLGQGLVAPGVLNSGLMMGGTGQTSGLGGLTTGHPTLFGTTGFYYNSQPVRGATVPR